jgi:hypothetical protein
MVKQDWLITEEEKERILGLHKRATENFYLLKEATEEEVPTKTIDFNFNYPSGWWSEKTPNLVNSVYTKLNEITEFIRKYKENKIKITVEVGESQVPNYNGEDPNIENIKKMKPKERFTYRMPEGQLANYRAGVIKRILDNVFDKYVSEGYITQKPEIVPTHTIGITKFTDKDKPTDEKYSKEQYVKFILSVEGKNDDKPCEINFILEINYDKGSNDRGINHECNAALFKIDANGIQLKTKDGTDADMNNGSKPWPPKDDKGRPEVKTKEFINSNPGKPGGYRYNQFIFTPELGKEVLGASSDGNITIRSVCMTPKDEDRGKGMGRCHQEVPHVILKSLDGKIIKDFFPNSVEGILCILDKCGNFIK